MGIYPTTDYKKQGDLLLEVYNDYSGVEKHIYYQPVLVIENRTDCFCCSCDREGDDAACRNHGHYGSRPCEEHNMPGYTWENEDGSDSGKMPASVQAARSGDRS